MFILILSNSSFQYDDKQIILKTVIKWPKHVKDIKLKDQNLSITLDGVLKILYKITSVTDQDEQN
jgi:hypothetical protein